LFKRISAFFQLHILFSDGIKVFIGFILAVPLLCMQDLQAQDDPLTVKLNEDGSRYLSLVGYTQFWVRHAELNPGSLTPAGTPTDHLTDISIRRFRLGVRGVIYEKLFTYLRFGFNNLNFQNGSRFSPQIFEAYTEYRPAKAFHVGIGKSAWNGVSRYTSPNVTGYLTLDLNLVIVPTINLTNDFTRLLSVYFKGQVSRLDYRFIIFKPYRLRNDVGEDDLLEGIAQFSDLLPENPIGTAGYIKWFFAETESNNTSFSRGTYYTDKQVLNLGTGFEFQQDRLASLENGEATGHNFLVYAVDFFWNKPLSKTQAFSLYGVFLQYDYGPNYLRTTNINNPILSTDPAETSLSGAGLSYPVLGTGHSFHAQAGYYFAYGEKKGFLPYAEIQMSDYDALDETGTTYDVGVNWLLRGEKVRLTVNYENRPIYNTRNNRSEITERAGQIVFQSQFSIH
jgi:hypothetical protein